jgi:hypothetical protein
MLQMSHPGRSEWVSEPGSPGGSRLSACGRYRPELWPDRATQRETTHVPLLTPRGRASPARSSDRGRALVRTERRRGRRSASGRRGVVEDLLEVGEGVLQIRPASQDRLWLPAGPRVSACGRIVVTGRCRTDP